VWKFKTIDKNRIASFYSGSSEENNINDFKTSRDRFIQQCDLIIKVKMIPEFIVFTITIKWQKN